MTGRSFVASVITVAIILALGVCNGRGKTPAPLQEAARIEYRVQIVVDSARVKQLEAENQRLARVAASTIGRARKSDSIATDFRAAADSITAAAYRAFKAEEKVELWQEAAQTHRLAVEASVMASRAKDSALVVRDTQIMRKDEIISTEQARRARAEQRVIELEPLAMRADDCKVVRFLNCPTRRQAFVAGGVTALALLAVAATR